MRHKVPIYGILLKNNFAYTETDTVAPLTGFEIRRAKDYDIGMEGLLAKVYRQRANSRRTSWPVCTFTSRAMHSDAESRVLNRKMLFGNRTKS